MAESVIVKKQVSRAEIEQKNINPPFFVKPNNNGSSFGVTKVNSVTVDNLPFGTTVDSATGAVTVSGTDAAPIQTTLSLGTILGSVTCVYRATNGSISGVTSNTDNSIAFTDQAFTKSSGPITCPGSGFFTATYAPVVDTTVEGGPVVFTN